MWLGPVFRWGVFTTFVLATLFWFSSGTSLSETLVHAKSHTPESVIAKLEAELKKNDPQSANELRKLRDQRDQRALAAMLQRTRRDEGLAALKTAVTSFSEPEYELTRLASNSNLCRSEDERSVFLTSHAPAIQVLAGAHSESANAYVRLLSKASVSNGDWAVVRDDPLAMIVWDAVTDQKLRDYYLREQDWLDEILVQVAGDANIDGHEEAQPANALVNAATNRIADLLTTAERCHPLLKDAATKAGIVDPEQVVDMLPLFESLGDVLKLAVDQGKLPLFDLIEVASANHEYLSERVSSSSVENVVAELIQIHKDKRSVWKTARSDQLVLRFNADAPEWADKVLESFEGGGIVSLIYTQYPDAVGPAAACLSKFGDLALWMLSHYAESNTFRKLLGDPKLGPRLIPYAARFGDNGLERVEENRGWLDKYFNPDGTERDEGWVKDIPIVGGPINVIDNLRQGHPSEWSEVGWAALDVADGVLLVVSAGTSEVVIQGVKQGGKGLGKALTRRELAELAKAAVKRAPSRFAKQAPRSFLKASLASGLHLVKSAGRGGRFLKWIGKPILKGGQTVLIVAGKINTGWKSVPPAYRRLVYRSLLAASLFISIKERTIPAMGKMADSVGMFVGKTIKQTGDALAAGLTSTIRELLPTGSSGSSLLVARIAWASGLIVLLYCCWRSRPFLRARRVRYV